MNKEKIQELVEIQSQGKGFPLPSLQQEISWLESLRKKILQWIAGLFNDAGLGDEITEYILYLVYIALVVVGVLLVYFFLKSFRFLPQQQKAGVRRRRGWQEGANQDFFMMYENLLREGQLSKAARIRWLLFLSRIGKGLKTTPSEMSMESKIFQKEEVVQSDHLMFGPRNMQNLVLLNSWEQMLQEKEKAMK